jgi:glyoxylase-like metal-dependent hydrolase (beta-lactamase superfamily II)
VAIVVDRISSGPPYGSNCYLLRADPRSAKALAVDPGGDPAELLAALRGLGASLAGILVTHGDVDHIAGVAELAQATGAEVWIPAGEAGALRAGSTRGGLHVRPHVPEHELSGGETLSLAGIDLSVVGVPGHSADHVAFCAGDALFAGDLLFAGSVGRTDLEGGDYATLLASVATLLERFGPGATVYPGHGEPTTLGEELAHNPFLGPLRA